MNHYCPNCGTKINKEDSYCANCGNQLNGVNKTQIIDNGDIGFGILGFFIPLAGLILYLVYKDNKPKTAKMAGKGALIRVIVNAVLIVLYLLFVFLFIYGAKKHIG